MFEFESGAVAPNRKSRIENRKFSRPPPSLSRIISLPPAPYVNLIETFIHRPVAATLLTAGVALAGIIAFRLLPVSPLPQVDYPTISVGASLAGASPDTMAATVATPLERALGRIAGITEMTSSSSLGSTRVTLQFDLNRDVNGAARDVQAALNAAVNILPSSLTRLPYYRKYNPADSPILMLALTSTNHSPGQIYDIASSILAQKITQIDGVGDATVSGGALPAVRIEINPQKLNALGIPFETVRNTIATTNANKAKGFIESDTRRWIITANDQATTPADYLPLIIAYRNGAPVRLSDVADVVQSVEDVRNSALFNGQPAILLIITRQPGANIIETVDRVKAMVPAFKAMMPAGIDIAISSDRSVTIRSSLHDVERTLVISVCLVILVVFFFLRSARTTLIPAIAVPVSLIGAVAMMWLFGFSLNNLSLMALTIATGFVVDDAIVVLENISRHIEMGKPRMRAALEGATEVGFTVLSMSLSLIAVFIPILLMGGIVGRLFREFAITLSMAILFSLLISLVTTPTLCARILPERRKKNRDDAPTPSRPRSEAEGNFRFSILDSRLDATAPNTQRSGSSQSKIENRKSKIPPRILTRLNPLALFDHFFTTLRHFYARTLPWFLRNSPITIFLVPGAIALTIYLAFIVPKGFFPQQDNGILMGMIQADQNLSFQAMSEKVTRLQAIVRADPDVAAVGSFTGGGGSRNGGFMYITLKPRSQRTATADQIINRLRPKSAAIPGATLFLTASQDIRIGGRSSAALYQFTLRSDDLAELRAWAPRILAAVMKIPGLTDVNSDAQDHGLQTTVTYNRDIMSAKGLTIAQANASLYDAFGQRQVSTLFKPLNQYHVIMEVAPKYWQGPSILDTLNIVTNSGARIPLPVIATHASTNTPLSVAHQSQFVANTISFNLAPNMSLSQATDAINNVVAQLGVPSSIQTGMQGTAKTFQDSMSSMPWLLLAAVLAVYIVLGILYESIIHPFTILSTIPSAGVGALIALKLFGAQFDLIALIGMLLLIGLVKKNAIMMIDFAITATRARNLTAGAAIYKAAVLRFRPIMMTTFAALLGAIPLALGSGEGSEMRRPLGITIVGGLIFSQLMTLYTTPVIYLCFDRLRAWLRALLASIRAQLFPTRPPTDVPPPLPEPPPLPSPLPEPQ